MSERTFEDEMREGCGRGKYCFPCVSGLCPLNLDFMTDCYPKLSPEQRQLFDELMRLRAEVVEGKVGGMRVEVVKL